MAMIRTMLGTMIQRRNDPGDDILERRIKEQVMSFVGQEAEGFYVSLLHTDETVEAVAAGVEEAKACAKRAQGDSVIHNLGSSNYVTRQLMAGTGQG